MPKIMSGQSGKSIGSLSDTPHCGKRYLKSRAREGCRSGAEDAARESFFALLQKNVLNRKTWAAREKLPVAMVTCLEATSYPRRRCQDGLGGLTPFEYGAIMSDE